MKIERRKRIANTYVFILARKISSPKKKKEIRRESKRNDLKQIDRSGGLRKVKTSEQ